MNFWMILKIIICKQQLEFNLKNTETIDNNKNNNKNNKNNINKNKSSIIAGKFDISYNIK